MHVPIAYLILKYIHIVSAILILGTGIGIAFFLLMAQRSRDAAFVARTAEVVVKADIIFTAPAMLAQPITGFLLTRQTGISLSECWIVASLMLYGIALLFWLPVLWLQARMRDLAVQAASIRTPLPASFDRLFRLWFFFGVPAAGAIFIIVWLMISKPPF